MGAVACSGDAPSAQLSAFFPEWTGAQECQNDGQYEAPEVPVVDEEEI